MKYSKNYCEEKEISTSELNEAQRTLYYIAENMKMDKSISEEGYKHFQMAIKALEQEPKIGHWTPVSEGPPKKNMRCLVAIGKFNFTEIATYSDLMGIKNHRIFYQGDYGKENFKDVTQYMKAWMPLPKPYEAESEDINANSN